MPTSQGPGQWGDEEPGQRGRGGESAARKEEQVPLMKVPEVTCKSAEILNEL